MGNLLTDVVADREEENQVTIDAEEFRFVNGSKICWRIE